MAGDQQAVLIGPFEAAVVADVNRPVRADRRAVGPAAGFRHNFAPAIGQDPGKASALNFDHQQRAIAHGDRPFGKAKSFGDGFDMHHSTLQWAG